MAGNPIEKAIMTILSPVFWVVEKLFPEKRVLYVPLKMNDPCHCKSGNAYKMCHFKKDKENGKTAYYIVRNNSRTRKYALLNDYQKQRLKKVYASDPKVKNSIGDLDVGAVYIMQHATIRNIHTPPDNIEYDITFDDGTFDGGDAD